MTGIDFRAQSLTIHLKLEYVLILLEGREEAYGLHIANYIEIASGESFTMGNHITEYLNDLYLLGFVERRWETDLERYERRRNNRGNQKGGPRRRRYWRITPKGRAALQELRRFRTSLGNGNSDFPE
jgi:DNA-binding PadR family transcriptional regulator